MRVGWGFDAHRRSDDGPMLFAGVEVASDRGLEGTSDADVVAHAVADALLGAAAMGDLGTYFPSSDPQWEGANSMQLLRQVADIVTAARYVPSSIDVTVIAQSVRVAPHRAAIRIALSELLEIPLDHVSVKATTTDGMGFLGRDEGVAATVVAVLRPSPTS
ncbi:MAG: 2-C-methyl-D-erythritol 2,4-cyclodiphosphate synthase [Acidimicrobiia bacterium]|nr:2-C-methyl-D-erythritol 2,4-cyclodiphosphate synthase [Acidimicrobiia bacterium]NNF64623.1 2-C-methyl-D-erythritol 2,4-cyclodiphosphate synthase [Acidimicrobiia bacterium]